VIREVNTTTGNVTDYLYGDDLIKQARAANDSYYLYDGLGSPRALSDNTGSITDSYDYESFGTILNQTGSTSNNYLFTGEQYDSGLDNYYLRARYYDQNVGRFTQMDTWMGNNQDPVTLHKYLYANANPVTYVDPTGNFSLVSFEAANTIRGILAETTVQVGFSILDSAFSDDQDAGPNVIGAGLATIGGPAAFKLLGMLSSKFRKAGCNSFDADTEVWTPAALIPISELSIGDMVWAYNEETGIFEEQEVVHLIQREGEYQLVELTIGSETIDVTENHPFFVKNDGVWKWKDAGEINVDDIIKGLHGNEKVVTGLHIKPHNGKVYNLTVDNVHTYLVGEQAVVAHNMGACDLVSLSPRLSNKFNAIQKKSLSGSVNSRVSGKVTASDAIILGTRFVGEGYTVSSGRKGAKTLISKDGLRSFTYPTVKNDSFTKTGVGVNFETRMKSSGRFTSNVHLDIKK
jgi:RHS repeat-associated protein